MTCRALLGCCALLPLLAGCGPAIESSPEGSTSSGSSLASSGSVDDADSTSMGSPGSGSSSSSTTTATAAESSTTGAVLETSSGTGTLDYCEDGPGRDYVRLVPETPSPPRGISQIDALCVVEGSTATEGLRTFQLHCDEGLEQPALYELDVYAHDGQNDALLEGETVRLRAYRNYPIDYGLVRVVLVTTPEGELLAGDYTWPEPSLPDEVAAWFDVSIEEFDVRCATVEPPPPVNTFVNDPCPFASTVMGANVAWAEYAVTLEPGERTSVGELLFSGSFERFAYDRGDVEGKCPSEGLGGGVAVLRQRG
jgi:hypothetical protein